ncbi:MAG: PCRF domain-containing protein, partial [Amphritea sp.]|nr:PCRF domain-containing protein [Amphritea sp.]
MEINPITNSLKDISERTEVLRTYLEYPEKQERLEEVTRELEDPAIWSEPERAQALGKERAMLEGVVKTIDDLTAGVGDARDLLDMAVEEDDEDTVEEVRAEVGG